MERELNFSGSSPLLYLISTPIGNLSEFSPRALEIVGEADYVACEDTRNSSLLLSHYQIKKPTISCHEHNEEEAATKIIALLKESKKIVYMSDAGYPGISDPGERLVKRAIAEGIKVSVVSGPSAFIAALVISGLPTNHFHFEGFLPAKESEKTARLNQLSKYEDTLIFYEAPHRIVKTLVAMAATLGDRKATLTRELTKAHEEVIRGSLVELTLLPEETLKGEMVIVVEGATQKKEIDDQTIAFALKDALEYGRSSKEAIASVSESLGVKKNRVYDIYLKSFGK